MKSEKLAEWIRHPEKIGTDGLREIEELVHRYPFFQTARILYLKALYLQAGARFRNELKSGTVHITDHKQLFRYLNNQIFFDNEIGQSVPNPLADIVDERLREINGHLEVTNQGIPACPSRLNTTVTQEDDEIISFNTDFPRISLHSQREEKTVSRLSSTQDTPVVSNPVTLDNIPGIIDDYNTFSYIPSADKETSHGKAEGNSGQSIPDLSEIPGMISEKETLSAPVLSIDLDLLEENTPISKSEELKQKSSLQTPEILSGGYQLTEKRQLISPITEQAGKEKGQTSKRKKKEELIDQFIQSDPVMPKINTSTIDQRDLSKENPYNQEELFSETLAKIYVRQHLYEKAIATYIKLSLKYPEKSVYFADRIEKIKENINNKE